MSSSLTERKITGTMYDLKIEKEQETARKEKARKEKAELMKQKKEQKRKREYEEYLRKKAKLSIKLCTCEEERENKEEVIELENYWNLPFKPYNIPKCEEINAMPTRRMKYKLKKIDLNIKINYSSVKILPFTRDPRLNYKTVEEYKEDRKCPIHG
uniref:Uncharacterized protein n=2 Tax=Clastoptera arizonana TaxID=38151 RepID=A0A1B6C445_9HEMI